MRINVKFQECENFKTDFVQNDQIIHPYFGEFASDGGTNDYSTLKNKPQINSITLEGNLTAEQLGLGKIYYDTKQGWDTQTYLIAERAAVYVYSDYEVIYDDQMNPTFIAGLKIGDGTSYLIDLPFVTDKMASILLNHIGDSSVHLTDAEREFWNNKITCYFDGGDLENLILSKTNYVIEGDILNG